MEDKKQANQPIFPGKKSIDSSQTRGEIRRDKNLLFSRYSIRGKEADELGRKMTDPKYGHFTEPQDIKKFTKDLKDQLKGNIVDSHQKEKIKSTIKYIEDRFGKNL